MVTLDLFVNGQVAGRLDGISLGGLTIAGCGRWPACTIIIATLQCDGRRVVHGNQLRQRQPTRATSAIGKVDLCNKTKIIEAATQGTVVWGEGFSKTSGTRWTP